MCSSGARTPSPPASCESSSSPLRPSIGTSRKPTRSAPIPTRSNPCAPTRSKAWSALSSAGGDASTSPAPQPLPDVCRRLCSAAAPAGFPHPPRLSLRGLDPRRGSTRCAHFRARRHAGLRAHRLAPRGLLPARVAAGLAARHPRLPDRPGLRLGLAHPPYVLYQASHDIPFY